MNNKLIGLLLIIIGVLSRLLPHQPNLTAIGAIALFAGVYLPKKYAIAIPLIAMIVSDYFLGAHPTILWVYGSFVLIAIIGQVFKNKFRSAQVLFLPLMSAILFFVVTNFGVWITSNTYSNNLAGLIECFTLAIPFFRGTLAGDIFYTIILFEGFKLLQKLPKMQFLVLQPHQ